MKSAICLLLALCVLPACRATQSQVDEPAPKSATTPADPVDMIRVYRVDGQLYQHDAEANQAAAAALETKLSFNRDEATLAELIAFVREEAGVNLVVNWPALELVGIDRDSLLSLQLESVAAGTLLDIALEQVSADVFDIDNPDVAIHDGVVKVSTIRELKESTETSIYDVSWFLDPRLNITTQLYDRDDPKRTGWLHGRVEKTGEHISIEADRLADWHFFCANCRGSTSKDGSVSIPSYAELVDQLVELIQVTVGEPDEWLDEESVIYDMAERLTVTTTRENHDAIFELLKMHRRAQVDAFEQQAKAIAITLLLRDAEQHRLKRDYHNALEHIDHALRVDPGHAEALVLRRLVIQAMGE